MQQHSVITSAAEPDAVPMSGTQLVGYQQRRGFSEKNKKTVTGLSALQMALGVFAIAFQAAAIRIADTKPSYYSKEYVACGIWCGIMFMITGLLGILARRKNSNSLIAAFLFFNCVTTIIVWVIVGFAAGNLVLLRECPSQYVVRSKASYIYTYYYSYYNGYYYFSGQFSTPRTSTTSSTTAAPYIYYYTDYEEDYSFCNGVNGRAWKAMDGLLLVLAIFEFAVAVTSAAYCCGALSKEFTPIYAVEQNASSTAGRNPHGPSRRLSVTQQGSSTQSPVFANIQVATDQTDYSVRGFDHATFPLQPIGYFYAPEISTRISQPTSGNTPDAPPPYSSIYNNVK